MSSTLTDLTAATTWSGTDLFYALVGGNSRKIAASNLWVKEAADTLALVNSTTAQTMRLYRTFTDSSNYERLELLSGAGYFQFWAHSAGTGTDNMDILFTPAGTGKCLSDVFAYADGTTAAVANGGIFVSTAGFFGFSSTSSYVGTRDVQLWRDGAAGMLAQRFEGQAQTFRVYRTWTDSTSNFERLALQTGSGYVELAAETAGTGTDNLDIRLTSAGTGGVKLNGSCGLYVGAGAPSFTAPQGSIYLNSTGSSTSTRLYVNTTGSTTWTNVVTAA